MAAKKKEALPILGNATPEFLVDELGDIRAQIKVLEKKEAFFKEALLGRIARKAGSYKGEKYIAIITNEARTGLDTQRIKEEQGEDWCAERSKTTEYQKVSTKELGDEE